MADRDVRLRLLIEAVNRAGKSLQDASSQLLGIGTSAEKANTSTKKLGSSGAASVSKLTQSLTKAREGFDALSKAGDRAAAAGRSIALVGAALTGAAIFPIKQAADFERQMSAVRAVTEGADENFDELTKTAQRLGRETRYSATQAAQGMELLGMAGLDATEVMTALESVLKLAAVGKLEVADAADKATNVMSAFGKTASDLAGVMDVLARTATSSNTNVSQLAEAISYVGPIASTAGVDLEEAAAAIGVLSSNGIQATRAGTALRGIIASLVKPTTEAQAELDALGVTIVKNDDGTLNLLETLKQLNKSQIEASSLFAVFRRTAAAGGAALSKYVDDVERLKNSNENANGSLNQMYDIMEKNLIGSLIELRSAFEGLLIAAGKPFLQTLTDLAKSLTVVVRGMTEWAEAHPKVVSAIVGVVGVVGVLATAIGGLLITIGSLVKVIGLMGTGLTVAIGGFARFGALIRGLPAAFTALRAAMASASVAAGAFTAALGVGIIIAATVAVQKAISAFLEAKQAFDEANDAINNGIKYANNLKNKYAEFKNVTKDIIPDNLADLSKEQFEEIYKQIRGLNAYWVATTTALQQQAMKTNFFGAATDDAKAAKAELERILPEYQKAKDLFNEVRAAAAERYKKEREEAQKTADQAKDVTEQKKKLSAEEIKAAKKAQEAILDIRSREIAVMEDSLAKIEAQRELELDKFFANEDAKALTVEQTQRTIAAIDAKYEKQRTDFIRDEASKRNALLKQLAEGQLQIQQAILDRQLAAARASYDRGEIDLETYFAARKRITEEKAAEEIQVLQDALERASTAGDAAALEIDIKVRREQLSSQLQDINNEILEAQKQRADQEIAVRQQTEDLKLQLRQNSATGIQERFDAELAIFDTNTERQLEALEKSKVSQDAIDEYYSTKKRERAQMVADHEKAVNKLVFDSTMSTIGVLGQAFGDLYEASGKKVKEFFILQKAAAIAQTIMSTYQSAVEAYKSLAGIPYVGPALGIAAAAVAVASGLAKVAQIKSQKLAGGGEVHGKSPNEKADNVPIWATAKEWVMPVASVKKYGRNVMHGIQKGLFPSSMFQGYALPTPGGARGFHFQEGGQVPTSGGNGAGSAADQAAQTINIVNITDPTMMDQWAQSKPGQRTIINVIGQNPFEVKQILSKES